MNGHSEDCDCNVCELQMLVEKMRQSRAEVNRMIYLEGKVTACKIIREKMDEWGTSGSYEDFGNQLIEAIRAE